MITVRGGSVKRTFVFFGGVNLPDDEPLNRSLGGDAKNARGRGSENRR